MISFNKSVALGHLRLLFFSREMLVGIYGCGRQVNMGKKPEHLSDTHQLVLDFDGYLFPGFYFFSGFKIACHAELKERSFLISSYPSLYHQSGVEFFGVAFGEGPLGLKGDRVELHLLFSVEADVKDRDFLACDEPYTSHDHRSTIPVSNTKDNPSFALRVLDSIECRLGVAELKIGLFLSCFCLLKETPNRYRRCERCGPSTQGADPRREAIPGSLANGFLSYRVSKDHYRAEEGHYPRSKPAHDVIRNHIGPHHFSRHIITCKHEVQWKVAA
ncbi:hypothetical protein ACI2KT_19065 [Ensifer adhaerens]|uniref:hypothetical protein n=1 Tax=Ensifer adhaerens TaxID=106592 RepID=UPI00384D9AFD